MFNTRGELQASFEHLTDEHREPLREAQVRAQAVQTRKSPVSCIGRTPHTRNQNALNTRSDSPDHRFGQLREIQDVSHTLRGPQLAAAGKCTRIRATRKTQNHHGRWFLGLPTFVPTLWIVSSLRGLFAAGQ